MFLFHAVLRQSDRHRLFSTDPPPAVAFHTSTHLELKQNIQWHIYFHYLFKQLALKCDNTNANGLFCDDMGTFIVLWCVERKCIISSTTASKRESLVSHDRTRSSLRAQLPEQRQQRPLRSAALRRLDDRYVGEGRQLFVCRSVLDSRGRLWRPA